MFRLRNAAARAECDRLLQAARAQKRALVSEMRQQAPGYAALRYPDPARPEEIQLPPDTALVVYEVMEDATAVFTLQRSKIAVDRVPVRRRDLDRDIRAFADSFRRITSKRDLERFDVAAAQRLQTQLVAPVRARLPAGVRRVILVPDETLALLSFEALVSRAAQPGTGVGYLLDDLELLYSPSATALLLQRPARPGGNPATYFVGDPVFSCRDPRWPRQAERRPVRESSSDLSRMGVAGLYDRSLGSGTGCAETTWPRLAKTAELAGRLDGLFPGRVQKSLGLAATETGVGRTDLSKFRYLVFATHGAQGDALPVGEPALVLTQVGNADPDDGFLTQSEVSTLVLDADVVALIACDTAVGHLQRGEGVLGLGRAFQHAGARNVLVSLWPVAEEAAVLLAAGFFSRIRDGAIPSLALRQAKLDLRAHGFEHPFYWAPFILVGTN
jgi:CHAT domain-containing protein